jgi:hypothetical protein
LLGGAHATPPGAANGPTPRQGRGRRGSSGGAAKAAAKPEVQPWQPSQQRQRGPWAPHARPAGPRSGRLQQWRRSWGPGPSAGPRVAHAGAGRIAGTRRPGGTPLANSTRPVPSSHAPQFKSRLAPDAAAVAHGGMRNHKNLSQASGGCPCTGSWGLGGGCRIGPPGPLAVDAATAVGGDEAGALCDPAAVPSPDSCMLETLHSRFHSRPVLHARASISSVAAPTPPARARL